MLIEKINVLKIDLLKMNADVIPQVEALKTQLGKLKSKAENSKQDIEKMLDTLDRAVDHLRRTRTSTDRASDELDMHEPIGTDVNAIKRQQEELQV